MPGATGVSDSTDDDIRDAEPCSFAAYCYALHENRVRDAYDVFLPVLPAYQGVINDLDFCRLAELRRSGSIACRSVCC